MKTKLFSFVASSLWLASCGADGGGVVGTGFSSLTGDVSSVQTSEAEEPLGGIVVTASADGVFATTETDASGRFSIPEAPSGDVLVEFRVAGCRPTLSLPDVAEDSVVVLDDVTVRCDEAAAGRIEESFVGVLLQRSAEILLVCIETGGFARPRTATPAGAVIRDAGGAPLSLDDLEPGDELRVTGRRVGAGAPSTVEADLVEVLGRDRESACPR